MGMRSGAIARVMVPSVLYKSCYILCVIFTVLFRHVLFGHETKKFIILKQINLKKIVTRFQTF